jgi:predicted methyltransferase
MGQFSLTRRSTLALAWALAACGKGAKETSAPQAPPGSLDWSIAGPWRFDAERDRWRHPSETLRFWGLSPGMTVLELLPGRGWLTAILAPYLAYGGGKLIACGFDANSQSLAQRETQADFNARFLSDANTYGHIQRTVITSAALAPNSSCDLAILDNNLNTLMAEGLAEHVFAQVLAALKPGGVFGVEQHRAASTGLQDPLAVSGYVQEAYVKTLAQEAGFEFVAASDINANPHDTRAHPFGVWSLPPYLRTSPIGQPDNPRYDTRPYAAIGESDRMTLKFRKRGANR